MIYTHTSMKKEACLHIEPLFSFVLVYNVFKGRDENEENN